METLLPWGSDQNNPEKLHKDSWTSEIMNEKYKSLFQYHQVEENAHKLLKIHNHRGKSQQEWVL